MNNIYIEPETLETAKENAENALKRVQAIDNVKSIAWKEAWNQYKELSSIYRSFLIANYNL